MFLTSWYPRWKPEWFEGNEEIYSLNAEIFREFVRVAESDGAIPIVVFLPSHEDFPKGSNRVKSYIPLSIEVLERSGVKFIDPRRCFLKLPPEEYFLSDLGRHYTSQGNAAVEECLFDRLRRERSQRTSQRKQAA
jgi:hypothetical protein